MAKKFIKKIEYKPLDATSYSAILCGMIVWVFINWIIGKSWLFGLIHAIITFILVVIFCQFILNRKVYWEEV